MPVRQMPGYESHLAVRLKVRALEQQLHSCVRLGHVLARAQCEAGLVVRGHLPARNSREHCEHDSKQNCDAEEDAHNDWGSKENLPLQKKPPHSKSKPVPS